MVGGVVGGGGGGKEINPLLPQWLPFTAGLGGERYKRSNNGDSKSGPEGKPGTHSEVVVWRKATINLHSQRTAL